jgi:hypothetical protein
MKFLRPRNYLLVGGTLLVMLFMWFSDPNGGALTATLAAQLATPVVAVWFAFLSRKALFDYADMLALYNKAKETALGAAIIFASMCIIMFALLGLFGNQLKAAEYIPTKALIYIPMLKVEQQALWVDHPKPIYSLEQ